VCWCNPSLCPADLPASFFYGTPPFVRLSLAGFILPLCTNLLVTTLIAARIWYLSPRKADDLHGTGRRFPTGTGRAAIDIVVESGMLYLARAARFRRPLRHRAPCPGHHRGDSRPDLRMFIITLQVKMIAIIRSVPGYRTSTHHHPRCSWLVKYAVRNHLQCGRVDFEACSHASAHWFQHSYELGWSR
jgi:hypothetical protein